MTLTDRQTGFGAKDAAAIGWTQGAPHMVGVFQVNGDPASRDELNRLRQEITGENLAMATVGDPSTGCAALVAAGFHGPSFAEHRQACGNGASRERAFWCVCDGRIDNLDDLLPELRSAGIRLQDHSAAEIVLAAYRLWGTECPIRLIGDYAFAVWDPEQRQLFCARDPALLKTFYYTFDGKRFAFASDPRTLLKALSLSRQYDNTYLTTYMVMYSQNWERTAWEQVKQIPGGCALSVTRDGLKDWRWWDLTEEAAGSLRYRKREQYYEHIRDLMDRAVGARMRNAGDGPVSIALSRGIDSCSIAARALNLWRSGAVDCGGLQGITVPANAHPEADESQDAAAIARHLGLKHTITENRPYLSDLRPAMQLMAEPCPGAGSWGFWEAMRAVCLLSGSKVLMTGAGGHELFGASPNNMVTLAQERRWLLFCREIGYWLQNGNSVPVTAELLINGLKHPEYRRTGAALLPYYPWIKHKENCMTDRRSATFAHPAVRQGYGGLVERGVRSSWFQRGLFAPFGIELRDPLFDRRLVEFSWMLPVRWKLYSGVNKPTLRRAFESELPLDMPKRNGDSTKSWGKHVAEGMKILTSILDDPPNGLFELVDDKILRDHIYRLGSSSKNFENHSISTAFQIACWLAAQEYYA